MDSLYTHTESEHNTIAADIIVPIIQSNYKISSVLDVGCGIGTWLHVFKKQSVNIILGIDGDYVNKDLLFKYIKPDEFLPVDLSKPFSLGKKFDLVVSLEVAEHLTPESAENFIDSLCNHGDIILFSAAVPGQDGQHHLNEQWPSYWSKLFEQHGYDCYDLLRPVFWNNPNVDVWYKQNMLVYSKMKLAAEPSKNIDIIHPDYWLHRNKKIASANLLLKRIREGKAGLLFYFKTLVRSLFLFGRKIEE